MNEANAATGATTYVTSAIPSGKLAMWWFLASEIITFGGLISCYIVFRVANPHWAEEAEHLSVVIVTFNTLVLLSSSLTMVLAFAAVERGDDRGTRTWLLLTVVGGLVFCSSKPLNGISKSLRAGFLVRAGFGPSTSP